MTRPHPRRRLGPSGPPPRRAPSPPRPIPHVLAAIVLLASLGDGGSARAQDDPDYSDYDDMLNGQRLISVSTDLIVADPQYVFDEFGETTGIEPVIATLLMSDSTFPLTSGVLAETDVPYGDGDCQTLPFPMQTRAARLGNISQDSAVTLWRASSDGGCAGTTLGLGVYTASGTPTFDTTLSVSSASWLQMAVADFDDNGYDDVLVFTDQEVFVVDLPGVNASGVTRYDTTALASDGSQAPISAPAVGDFNADGLLEVVWVGGDVLDDSGDIALYTATVCPSDDGPGVCAGQDRFDVVLQSSATIDGLFSLGHHCSATSAVMVGNFDGRADVDGNVQDQLLLAWATEDTSDQKCKASIAYYELDDDSTWTQLGVADDFMSSDAGYDDVRLYGTAGPLAWFSGNMVEQAVLGLSTKNDAEYRVYLYTFNCAEETCTPTIPTATRSEVESSDHHLYGLTLGRFNDDDSSTDPTVYDLQLASLMRLADSKTVRAGLYDFDCSTDGTTCSLGDTLDVQQFSNGFGDGWVLSDESLYVGNGLHAGDLQGNSIRVGPPLVTRQANHAQADVILEQPPMHVDYVLADEQTDPTQTWQPVNFSGLPSSFTAAYSVEESDTDQSSSTSTTSYSTTETESVGAEVKFTIPAGTDAKTKNSWTNAYASQVSSSLSSYTSQTFDASTATDVSGQLWFSVNRLNVYSYPVLGQTTCDADGTDCGQQAYMTLAGPDQTSRYTVESATVEWYQPFSEPYQIFSQATTLDALEARDGTLLPLTDTTLSFATDNNTETFSVSWSEGSSDGSSVSSTTTHSFSTSDSVTLGTPLLDEVDTGASITESYDYSESTSLSTQTTQTLTLGASSGISIAAPDTFLNAGLYSYPVTPLVSGSPLPSGTIQDVSGDGDIQTTGPLVTQFLADPTDTTSGFAGSWWTSEVTPYTQYVDVALNHPARWSAVVARYDSLNCLWVNDELINQDCLFFNGPDTGDLWNSEFYWMRGLTVGVDTPAGPLRNTAVEGDTVYLTARVYNYSMAALPDGAEVHVRFYRQPWNDDDNTADGHAVLIDELTVDGDALPAFATGSSNWTTVTTSFDTTGLADTYLVFWVVVWAEDSTGALLSELPGHGLSAIPGDLVNISEVPLEEVTYTQADVTYTTSFSNNVGLLHMDFYVADDDEDDDASSATVYARPAATSAAPDDAALTIASLAATPSLPTVGDKVSLAARIGATGDDADGLLVLFTQEDARGTTTIDAEHLTRLHAGDTREARVPWRPRSCGPNRMSVLAHAGGPGGVREAETAIDVHVACRADARRAKGRARKIASARENGAVLLHALFDPVDGVILDPSRLRVTLEKVLAGSNGELVAGLPSTPLIARAVRRDRATFVTPDDAAPRVRVRLRKRRDGTLRVRLRVDGATIAAPSCRQEPSIAPALETVLRLDDSQGESPTMRAVLRSDWRCATGPRGSRLVLRGKRLGAPKGG